MPKNLLQDVVKIKKNVPNIRVDLNYGHKHQEIKHQEIEKKEIKQSDGGSRYRLWFVAMISVLILLFAVSFLFSGAKITINPKIKNLVLNENLNAIRDSNDANNLSFDVVSISGEETKTIPGGVEKDVAEKAKGTVVIYNAFNSSPQLLSIDTRLEGTNGKMYKTEKAITVPGMGSNGTPGSVEVGIYGVEAGAEYNSAPVDFKIFGFKNTPKYSKFYARSKGEIIGGLKGKSRQVSDEEKIATINELKTTLQAKLLKKATDQIPSGYILFKDAIFLDDDGGSMSIASTDGLVPMTLKGTFYGFLFEEKKLTEKIVKDNIDNYDGSEVYIPNIRDLTFYLANKENISFKDVTNIDFNLSGSVKIVWKVDEEKLINDVLGKKKKDFNQIMSQYANIDSADLTLKPIWKMSFPDKIKDIKVIVNYPQ